MNIPFNFRLTEIQAAIARQQLKKLDKFNAHRIELVEMLNNSLSTHPFLSPSKGRDRCHSTFYIYPLRFLGHEVGCSREEFVAALNAEGAQFYQGYVQPLYLQPLYQRQELFKYGYPFSAPENDNHTGCYEKGNCPIAEMLHLYQMIINEHVRWPHTAKDIDQLAQILLKVTG